VFPLFATGVFDIGGKFAAGIKKKFKMILSVAWGR
jgi:hypothetical protein